MQPGLRDDDFDKISLLGDPILSPIVGKSLCHRFLPLHVSTASDGTNSGFDFEGVSYGDLESWHGLGPPWTPCTAHGLAYFAVHEGGMGLEGFGKSSLHLEGIADDIVLLG